MSNGGAALIHVVCGGIEKHISLSLSLFLCVCVCAVLPAEFMSGRPPPAERYYMDDVCVIPQPRVIVSQLDNRKPQTQQTHQQPFPLQGGPTSFQHHQSFPHVQFCKDKYIFTTYSILSFQAQMIQSYL